MSDKDITALLEWIGCLLEETRDLGFGDPAKSAGNTVATGANYVLVCSNADKPGILYLRNGGAAIVEFACSDQGPGFGLQPSDAVVVDRFKGRIYARSSGGASSLQWYIMARNVSD